MTKREPDAWEDIPDRVMPAPGRPKHNPDRVASADPIWGHTGVTKRTIMQWLAERDGKLDLLLRRDSTRWHVDEASEYFVETRHAAEHLIKMLRKAGVPIGWTE